MTEAEAHAAPSRRRAVNPVLAREIKERMRSPRATILVVVYLALLAGILYLAYQFGRQVVLQAGFFDEGGAFGRPGLGRTMFEWLLFFLLVFIAFIAPGTAAHAIVGERERRTLHLLQVTLLRPRSIALGKASASVAFLLLLVLAAAPLFAVPLVLGGVTVGQVIRGFVVVLALMLFLASLGTYLSAVARRSQFATVNSYALTFMLMVGTLLAWGAESIWREQRRAVECSRGECPPDAAPIRALAPYLNPFAAVADAVVDLHAPVFAPSPFSMFRSLIASQAEVREGIVIDGQVVRPVPAPVPAPVRAPPPAPGVEPGTPVPPEPPPSPATEAPAPEPPPAAAAPPPHRSPPR